MDIWGRVKSILRGDFSGSASKSGRPDFVWPGSAASIEDHVQYLIDSRDFVANYPVPPDANYRQYKHNPDGRIVGGDESRPAITDCCYKFRDRDYLSVGFPLHVPSDDNFFNPNGDGLRDDIGFSRLFYQDSLHRLIIHATGEDGFNGNSAKVGYQNGTHWYVECNTISEEYSEKGRVIIDELVHSTRTNPTELLSAITNRLNQSQVQPSPDRLSARAAATTPPI